MKLYHPIIAVVLLTLLASSASSYFAAYFQLGTLVDFGDWPSPTPNERIYRSQWLVNLFRPAAIVESSLSDRPVIVKYAPEVEVDFEVGP